MAKGKRVVLLPKKTNSFNSSLWENQFYNFLHHWLFHITWIFLQKCLGSVMGSASGCTGSTTTSSMYNLTWVYYRDQLATKDSKRITRKRRLSLQFH